MGKKAGAGKNRLNVKRSRGQEIWMQFKKNKGAMIGLVIFSLIIIAAVGAQVFYDYDLHITKMTPEETLLAPSWSHPFGTDHMGRDVLARILYGARYSLLISVTSVIISTSLGVAIGAVAGYYGGVIETVVMRAVEILMMVPSLLLTIVIVSVLGINMPNLIIALSIGGIPYMARQVRASVLTLRNSDFVESSRAIGVSDFLIIVTHILPNSLSPIIVSATIHIGGVIVAAATYSFLGLGVQAPTPEWGALLSDARIHMREHVNLILFPGLAIMLTAMSANLVGDGLRDALDPKLKR